MKKPYYHIDDYQMDNSIGYLLRQLLNQIIPRVEVLFAHEELTFTHWIVLKAIREDVATTCAELSRCLNYDSGAATRLIDHLETRGLVERHRSSEDRRVSNLALTAEGRATAKALTHRVVDYWNELLGDFTRPEIDTLIDLLSRLLTRVEQEPAGVLPVPPTAAKKHKVP